MEPKELNQYRRFRPAWRSFSVYFLGALIFGLGPQVNPQAPISPALSQLIATCFLAFIALKRFTSEYTLNSDELTAVTSFPLSKRQNLPVNQISRIDLRRGISQRLLGVAHVHVYQKGQEEPVVNLFGVPEPDKFHKLLMDMGAGDQRVTGAWRK